MFEDLVEVDDRSGRHREFTGQFVEGGPIGRSSFHAIHRDDEARDLHVSGSAKHRDRLADRGTRGGDILDNQHSVAVA